MKQFIQKIGSFFVFLYVFILIAIAMVIVSWRLDLNQTYRHSFIVPANVEQELIIDFRKDAYDLYTSMVIAGQGDDLISSLKKQYKRGSDKRMYGIQYLAPIQYFKCKYNGKSVQGLIATVGDERVWDKEINWLLGNVSAAVRKGRSGIVVQSNEMTRDELYAFIEAHSLKNPKRPKRIQDTDFMYARFKNVEFKGDARWMFEGNKLVVNSELEKRTKESVIATSYQLQPSDLHISTNLIGKDLLDSIQSILGYHFPISGFSINYKGLKIDEYNGDFLPLPNADILLNFRKSYSVEELVSYIPNAKLGVNKNELVYGNNQLYISQVDDKTIFIGASKESMKLIPGSGSPVFIANGPLTPILNIEANSFVRMALRMNEMYGLLSGVASKSKSVEVKLKDSINGKLLVNMQLELKSDKVAPITLLEAIMR